MILDNWLAQRADTVPDRTALVADGMRIAYADLESEAAAAARRLASKGVRPGAAVMLEMPAGVEYVVLLHALMKLGAVAVPLNPRLAAQEREAQIASVNPALELTGTGQVTGDEADIPLLG